MRELIERTIARTCLAGKGTGVVKVNSRRDRTSGSIRLSVKNASVTAKSRNIARRFWAFRANNIVTS